jgi:endonuclease/exonuclease/phosphatase family metal-dependent hydrolase
MTLNLNLYSSGHGPWAERRKQVLEMIAQNPPDVLAFQAVCSDPGLEGGLDQAAQISASFPEYQSCFFHPSMRFEDGSQEGSALLARFPISALQIISLTHRSGTDDPNQRAVLHACLELPDGPLHLLNAHFSWVSTQAVENALEVIEYSHGLEQRALMVGDLNNPPDSAAIQQLKAAGWVDVWEVLHPDEKGYTFEASNPRLRIDYALANERILPEIRAVKVLQCSPETGGNCGGTEHSRKGYASDHFGLLVEIGSDAVI